MFFKKKVIAQPLDMGTLLIKLSTVVYHSIGNPDGSSSVSATLEFDDLQRVANIVNPLVDGLPKVPTFEAIETMNTIAQPMKDLPANQKLKSLTVAIEGGKISTDVEYLIK